MICLAAVAPSVAECRRRDLPPGAPCGGAVVRRPVQAPGSVSRLALGRRAAGVRRGAAAPRRRRAAAAPLSASREVGAESKLAPCIDRPADAFSTSSRTDGSSGQLRADSSIGQLAAGEPSREIDVLNAAAVTSERRPGRMSGARSSSDSTSRSPSSAAPSLTATVLTLASSAPSGRAPPRRPARCGAARANDRGDAELQRGRSSSGHRAGRFRIARMAGWSAS